VGAKIGYECIAVDHRPGHGTPDLPDKLTIFEGEWAFCPTGSQTAHHEWKAIVGQELSDLIRQSSHSIVRTAESDTREGDRA
jgi:hypothetical protein